MNIKIGPHCQKIINFITCCKKKNDNPQKVIALNNLEISQKVNQCIVLPDLNSVE